MQNLKSKKILIIEDRIYGKFRISTPIILEIINSAEFRRLKKISQFGVPDEFYHLKNFTRDEHSIGVYILLSKLGASEKEQIAGLLHDISHTAFSHVYDWIEGNEREEHSQDKNHKTFLLKSDIAKILRKHSYDPLIISNLHKFSLLDTEIPNLCADRIDYALREFPLPIAKKCLKGLFVKNKKIFFKDEKTAFLFAENFLIRQNEHWGGLEAVVRYALFGKALKIALSEKIILNSDFWGEEEKIIKAVKKSKNKLLQNYLRFMKHSPLLKTKEGKEIRYKKFRYVDPIFLSNGKEIKLSKVNANFKKMLEKSRIENSKGVTIPDLRE